MSFFKKKEEGEGMDQDLKLLEQIQPLGGIHFKEDRYITTGTGYESCLSIIDFPSTLKDNWLSVVTKIDDVVSIVDISTENPETTIANITRSMKEQNQRAQTSKEYDERKEAERRKSELNMHYNEVSFYQQVMKNVQIRLFVPGDSREQIDTKVGAIKTKLKTPGYKTAVFLGETKQEFRSGFQSYREQQEYPYAIYGQPLTAEALGYGNPFWFTALYDPHGIPLGTTPSDGDVFFDPGCVTEHRTHYSGAIMGKPGSGKSTLAKKLISSLASRGDYIRLFDIVGDFGAMGKEYGFKEVVYGRDGIINILHIYRGGETENESYAKHTSKVSTFYKCLKPETTSKEIGHLEEQLGILYEKFQIKIADRVTGYPAERYPILEDFVKSIAEEIDKISELSESMNRAKRELTIENLKLLDNIKKTLESAITAFGVFINGHSSIDNLQEEQLVTFNITALKDVRSTIFDACIECLFSLTWDNMVTNGTIMKNKFENGEIEEDEIVRFYTFVDESHNWINESKPFMVDECIRYVKEARKFFGGFWYVFHQASDVMKGGNEGGKSREQLKALFSLTQYKFVFAQGKEDIELLQKLFGNNFTAYQQRVIPAFGKGQCFLCISGMRNIMMKVALSETEKQLFKGGV